MSNVFEEKLPTKFPKPLCSFNFLFLYFEIQLSIRSIPRSFVPTFTLWLTDGLIEFFIVSFIRSFVISVFCLFIYLFIYLFIFVSVFIGLFFVCLFTYVQNVRKASFLTKSRGIARSVHATPRKTIKVR